MEEGLCGCEANEGNVDRISNLPEEVIQRILSSLETKDAVRTSVLSRRWRSRWVCVTNLDLSEFVPNKSQKRSLFMDFVERVIALREPSHLNRFALACEVLTDGSRINSWICAAVEHNAEHLLLQLDQCLGGCPFELPHCLFTCDTLRTAVIKLDFPLQLPSSIHFSSLKILSLRYAIFLDHHSTHGLFSGLPVLEELTLDRCSSHPLVKAVTIALPMLQKLDIIEDLMDDCRFHIIAQKLKSFYYSGQLLNDYCIYDSVSLGYVFMLIWDIDNIKDSNRKREVVYRADRLLRGISCVKELMLTSYAFEVLTCAKELYACMPILHKVTRLEFRLPGRAINFSGGTLVQFLQKLPCLELLLFQSGIRLSGNYEDRNWVLDPVPSCFSTHLRFIEIRKFCGTDGELQVVKSLLRNAEMLRDMEIICHHKKFAGFYGGSTKRNVLRQLQMLPRASIYCKIHFS